jgi:hypothetical protein
MNIVEVITNQLSGKAGMLSSLLGQDESTTKSAVQAAVPSLLMSLAGLAKNSDGAQKLASVLNNFDPKSVNMDQPSSILSTGTKLLGSLFGGDTLSGITGALSSHTGVSSGIMKSILGYISPLVLGTIASHFKGGINPSSLTKFFGEQEAHIASAMPEGLSLPSMAAAEPAKEYAESTPAAPQKKSFNWGLAVLLLALLVGLYYWWNNTHKTSEVGENRPAPTATPREKTEPEPIETAAPGGDFSNAGKTLSDTYSKLTDTLDTIKDVPTAKAALPALKSMGDHIENMKSMLDKMPQSARTELKSVSSEHLGKLKDKITTLLSNPALSEVLKPALDRILSGLTSLS